MCNNLLSESPEITEADDRTASNSGVLFDGSKLLVPKGARRCPSLTVEMVALESK